MEIEFSTSTISHLFFRVLKSFVAAKSKFNKNKILLPKTANLFGVMPHSKIRNIIAESAMLLTNIVTTDNKNRITVAIQFPADLDVSATEKKIIAITPISNILKMSKNSLSL